MKIKLTTLLFGLLLAVGWTAPTRAEVNPEMVSLTSAEADALTYEWVDANGVSHTSKATDVAEDPYQIYELLRFVYMDKRFPGPTKSAWTSSSLPSLTTYDTREDPVYYGGIGHGWNIGASYTAVPNSNITITMSGADVCFSAITLIGDGQVIKQWNLDDGTNIASTTGWTVSGSVRLSTTGAFCYFSNSGTITIPYSQFSSGNYSSLRVVVTACEYDGGSNYIRCNGFTQTPYTRSEIQQLEKLETTPSYAEALRDYGWTITGTETLSADGTYEPNNEGYTALIVSVKDEIISFPYAEPMSYLGSCAFYSKKEVIDYIAMSIKSVKLLTDGLRIGNSSDYSRGTVFNCDGRYNKFFFLSKGQARKKATYVKNQISGGTWPSYAGDEVPFSYMYEEFSPTTGAQGDEINDFYSEMMEGNVYNVVHDCASVIQNGHQFSLSGNAGKTSYGFTGMNFFIPDFRLALWWNAQSINGTNRQYVDGRDFVPYRYYSTGYNSGWQSVNAAAGYWSANYAQYNQTYAPKVGIYRITLEAEAHQCTGYNEDTNPYYEVTLNWTSSLNEMSGHDVPQKYIIYEVTYDSITGKEVLDSITTVQEVTTYTFPCPPNYKQGDYSQTHTYVIKGWPIDNDHPSFIAWSNQDDVVIPGLKDFLKLDLDHYESDFKIAEERNYYRNFLMVLNENELKALTTADLMNGMTKYTLYRYDVDTANVLTPFAQINFTKPTSVDVSTVSYSTTYQHQNIEDGDNSKYARSAMGIPDNGTLRVKGNGDVIIWPNDLSVNFKSIKVGNTTWSASSNTSLPNGWGTSPGCKWVKYNDAYYLEGKGYIYAPASTTGDVTVTINAYGDGSTTSKITVNDVTKTIANGAANATNYEWTVSAASRAPKRDGNRATTVVTFTAGTDQGNNNTTNYGTPGADQVSKSGVTFACTSAALRANPYRIYQGTVTVSTTEGNITNIVINGSNNSYSVTRLSGTGYSTNNNNVGTWTGSASSVSLTASGQVRISSIVVTVSTDEPPTPGDSKIYEKVTSTDQLVAGKNYILVNETANAFMGAISTYGAAITGPTIANESVTITGNEGILELTLGGEEGAWTLTADGSNYIAYTGSSNTLTTGTDPSATSAQWTATANNGGYRLTNVGTSNRVLQYNSGSPRFACYTSSQADAFLYVEKVDAPTPVTDGHMIRLAIPVVDQFYASTATNTHPRGYGYVLKYVPETVTATDTVRESSRVEVPVQHTGSTVNGYYTKTQVDNDKDRKLTTDIMSADVDMTLSATNTKVFYNTIQGKANALPAEYANYYTVLQRQTDGTFIEMKSPSPLTGKIYQPGEYHYYDSIATTGTYGQSYKTYVPVVMTMGQDRRYYEDDSLHNTYGAPIWKTGVGQVRDLKTEAQMQRGPQGSTQWQDAQGKACSLYFLGVDAYGDLPSAEVSNIVYEPYMFRVWIQSPSNKLRGCTHVAAGVDPDKPGAHWDGDGTTYGSEPVCVYEGTTTDGHLVLDVQSMAEGNNQPWGEKIQFGAVDNIDDLKIYVRFYYKSTGVAQEAVPATLMLGNRADDSRDYYAAEGSENADDVTTSIHGVYVDFNKTVDSVTYVNTQGMKSDKPFDGVNIVITRYSDGTTSVSKVVK